MAARVRHAHVGWNGGELSWALEGGLEGGVRGCGVCGGKVWGVRRGLRECRGKSGGVGWGGGS